MFNKLTPEQIQAKRNKYPDWDSSMFRDEYDQLVEELPTKYKRRASELRAEGMTRMQAVIILLKEATE